MLKLYDVSFTEHSDNTCHGANGEELSGIDCGEYVCEGEVIHIRNYH